MRHLWPQRVWVRLFVSYDLNLFGIILYLFLGYPSSYFLHVWSSSMRESWEGWAASWLSMDEMIPSFLYCWFSLFLHPFPSKDWSSIGCFASWSTYVTTLFIKGLLPKFMFARSPLEAKSQVQEKISHWNKKRIGNFFCIIDFLYSRILSLQKIEAR